MRVKKSAESYKTRVKGRDWLSNVIRETGNISAMLKDENIPPPCLIALSLS